MSDILISDPTIVAGTANLTDVVPVYQVGVAQPKTITVRQIADLTAGELAVVLEGKRGLHGFENLTDTSLPEPYTGTNVFTLTKVNNFDVFFGGVKATFVASKSIDISLTAEWLGYTADQRKGQWFITIYPDGTLNATKTPFDILNTAHTPVATNYFDGTWWIPAEERHGIDRNLLTNYILHNAYGAAYFSGFSASPTFAAGAGNTFSFAGGIISDEGLLSVTNGAQTTCRIGYRIAGGASMTWDASGTAYAKLSAGVPVYDNAGTLTALGAAKYGLFWIHQTNRVGVTNKITSIVGQGQYDSISAAQAAARPTLAGLSVAEWRAVYRVIVRNVGGVLSFIQADPVYAESVGPVIQAGAPSVVSAGNVTFIPTGSVVATNVQAMGEELDTEKLPKTADVIEVTGTTATVLTSWNGKRVRFTNAAGCTLTIPATTGFTAGFQCSLFADAAGTVALSGTVVATGTNILTKKGATLRMDDVFHATGGLS